jgi:hypothetical protein
VAILAAKVAARAAARNREAVRNAWRFSVADARRTLPHLYPIPDDAT